jgi:serine/threonine-protein kinase RsbW
VPQCDFNCDLTSQPLSFEVPVNNRVQPCQRPLTFPQGRFKLANLPGEPRRLLSRGEPFVFGQPRRTPLAETCSFSVTNSLTPLLMAGDRFSYNLDSTLETVDNAEQTASRIAAESGFGEDEVMQIAMAVREGVVNAVLHGNAYDPEKKVDLEFERTAKDLVITIRDQGKGLDLGKIPDPLAPENLLKTSGRGIFLIRSFMDVVEIHPSKTGTEIKLIKHVHGPAEGGKEASQ